MLRDQLPDAWFSWPDLAEARVAAASRRFRPVSIAAIRMTTDSVPSLLWASVQLGSAFREGDLSGLQCVGRAIVILEDADLDGALHALGRVRTHLVDREPSLRFWSGVSSFPRSGLSGCEVLEQSLRCLERAGEWPDGRIETSIDRQADAIVERPS